MELSRRAFLKSSLAAAGVGALGLLSGCSTDQPSAQTTPLTQPDDASQTSSLDAPYAALDAPVRSRKKRSTSSLLEPGLRACAPRSEPRRTAFLSR